MKSKKKKLKKPSVTTKTTKFEILRVDWEDHNAGNHGWRPISDMVHRPLHCVSVGVNVREDEKGLTLVQTMGHNMDVADTIYILKSCITKRQSCGYVEYAKEA